MPSQVQQIIATLELAPHPEGGWYRETWRAEAGDGGRALATAILFLLDEHQRSRWHRVDAAELWLWHAGHPLLLSTAPGDAGPTTSVQLGPDVLEGATPQHLIEADHWQSAYAESGWTLVSCVVSPGFEFDGFQLAPDRWQPV